MTLSTRERNAWTAVSAVAAALEGFCIFVVLNSKSFAIASSNWAPAPTYLLAASLAICIGVNIVPITLARKETFSLLSHAQNPMMSLQRMIWYPVVYIAIAAPVVPVLTTLSCGALMLSACVLIMSSQLLTRPMVARNLYTRDVVVRTIPMTFATLFYALPLVILHMYATQEFTAILTAGVILDVIVHAFSACGNPNVFIAAQYGHMLVVISSQVSICLSASAMSFV